jgi:hypothetical protein
MDAEKLALLGILVGALAAFSAMINALVAIVGAWRDSRRLTITVEVKEKPKGGAAWTIRIWNRARTPNALTMLEIYVDGKKMEQGLAVFSKAESPIVNSSLAAFSYAQADLYARAGDEIPQPVWDAYETIELRVHPVRGRRRRFKFRRKDLAPTS